MLVSLNWLKEFVPVDLPIPELSHLLSMAGLEVDAVKMPPTLDAHFVVALIESVEPHPDADRLSLVKVDDGQGGRVVVCGAKNMGPGDRVILATPGAEMAAGFTIKSAKIRGIRSEGMLCSATELGLFEDPSGLLILGGDAAPGTPATDVLPSPGPILELGLTPNRSDCLSMEGLGRELAALTEQRHIPLETAPAEDASLDQATRYATLRNQDLEGCPRYLGRVITDVKVGPSPLWMKARLAAAGVRSINNVVDATNYVMLELGQPLHAFDLDRLGGQTVVVRRAAPGERLHFLDGQDRTLCAEDLVICDDTRPLALAGVMGGEESGVNAQTTRLLLESAYFVPLTVRLSARRYGLHTESSHRFERGVDPDGQRRAIDRLAEVILEVAGGRLAPGHLRGGEGIPEAEPIAVDGDAIRSLLGLDLPDAEIVECLRRLDIHVSGDGQNITARPPRARVDLLTNVDLAEEVARVHGYERIPLTSPVGEVRSPRVPPLWARTRLMEDHLVQRGFSEAVTFTFIPPSWLDKVGIPEGDARRQVVRLLKPLSEDMSIMRPLLAPSLLQVAAHNANRQNPDLALFEVGRTFAPTALDVDSAEVETLGLLLTGRRHPRSWGTPGDDAVDLYDLRGALESLNQALDLHPLTFEPGAEEPWLIPGRAWTLSRGDRRIGVAGELHPRVGAAFGLEAGVLIAELTLEALFSAPVVRTATPSLPIYPRTQRDLALMVAQDVVAGDILTHIQGLKEPLVEDVALFDVYEGKQVEAGHKSLAFSVAYRSGERTLTEAEVGEAHGRILASVQATFGASLR